MNFIVTKKGLLTVDPQKRLTLNEVMASSWLVPKIREPPLGFTPLMTPGILSIRSFAKTTELAVKQTIDAFHMAAREGFRLQVSNPRPCVFVSKFSKGFIFEQDVCNARLAQRRKAKRSSNDARSVSTSSSFSSSSSGTTVHPQMMSISMNVPSDRFLFRQLVDANSQQRGRLCLLVFRWLHATQNDVGRRQRVQLSRGPCSRISVKPVGG